MPPKRYSAIEPLESRTFLSATLAGDWAVLSSRGILQLSGTAGDEGITVVRQGKRLEITRNDESFTIAASRVKGISVSLGSGDDAFVSEAAIPTTVFGGAGDDEIVTAGGKDRVYGGSGSDYIETAGGNDEVYGASGNDTVLGGAGSDRLHGGAGSDYLDGGQGNDSLYGEDGNDILAGSAGKNTLQGGRGHNRTSRVSLPCKMINLARFSTPTATQSSCGSYVKGATLTLNALPYVPESLSSISLITASDPIITTIITIGTLILSPRTIGGSALTLTYSGQIH